MTAPRRRWFRFSLRAIFVAVTLLACWLGYCANWIRARHAASQWPGVRISGLSSPFPAPPVGAPWQLAMLGELGCEKIELFGDSGRAAEDRLRRLFPEAEIAHFVW